MNAKILLRLLQNFSFVRASIKNRSFISRRSREMAGLLPEKLLNRGKTNRVLQAALLTGFSFFVILNILAACAGPEQNRNNFLKETPAILPPKQTTPALRIINHKNEGGTMVPWLRSYLGNGIAGPESMPNYRGSYLFVSSIHASSISVAHQWVERFLADRDVSRLVAERIRARLEKDLSVNPYVYYGANYEKAVKAAYGTSFWGSRKIDDFWVYGVSAVQNDEEPESPKYWAFILVDIPRETLEIQVTALLSKITPSSGGKTTKEQNAAFNDARERFFEQF